MYVIKQGTGFIPYYVSSWDGTSETFDRLIARAVRFPTMAVALQAAEAIARKHLLRGHGAPLIPLKIVSLDSQSHSRGGRSIH